MNRTPTVVLGAEVGSCAIAIQNHELEFAADSCLSAMRKHGTHRGAGIFVFKRESPPLITLIALCALFHV